MPPRDTKAGPPFNRANAPFYPAADTTTFKDLLLFEERLKMNAQMLRKRKRRYEAFLAVLVGFIVLLAHRLVFEPPEHTFWRYLAQGTLAVALVTLVLFFASGMYEERIRYANRYVPHANKSLRTINMHLNMRRPTFSLVPARFRSLPAPPPPPIAPSKRTTSSVIPPIPPTNNPRGELIFSNRVDRNFKEGYERYRAAFERRREERLKETSTGRRWGWFRRPSPARAPGSRPSPAVSRRNTPPPGEKRTPSPSRVNGRSQSPSTGSKLRPCEEEKPVIPIHVYEEHKGDKGNRARAESYSFVFSGTERLRPSMN